MMAEGTEVDDVMFRVGDQNEAAVFHPSGYHDYHSSDDELSSDDEYEDDSGKYTEDLPPDQVSKPLMHPRQRPRVKVKRAKRKNWQHIVWPIVYMFIFLASMAAFVCLIVYVVNTYTNKLLLAEFNHMPQSRGQQNKTLIGCSDVEVEDVWVVGRPKILTESAFRLLDVNQDGILDVIFGFATGADKLRADPLVCDIYFNGTKPCGGGILALDGRNGDTLWQHWSAHEVFGLNCGADLDGDGVNDCIGGGRAGTFEAVSGRSGLGLWTFNDSTLNTVMNVYTGQFIGDIDGDGIQDILTVHGGDPLGEPGSNTRLAGKILTFSGRTGKVLGWQEVPDHRESYYSPVLYRRRDASDFVLFGTGGETHGGSLWLITLGDLLKGQILKAKPLVSDTFKGFMTPPVLVDINRDGTEDIVFATFNSTIVALDGESYQMLWNFSYPMSETYATPAAGFYNDDDVPDFLIRWQTGPGFPLYYHSMTTVLDGATGQPLVTPYLMDSIGAQTSPLTISMQGHGNDLFLYWIADCKGHEGQSRKFSFIKGTNVHEQTRSDLCRVRFKTSGYSRMMALGQHLTASAVTIYDSELRTAREHQDWVNTTALAHDFLRSHPRNLRDYHRWQHWVQQQQDKWRSKDRHKPRPYQNNGDEPNDGQPVPNGDYPLNPAYPEDYPSRGDYDRYETPDTGYSDRHQYYDNDNNNDMPHGSRTFENMFGSSERGYKSPEDAEYEEDPPLAEHGGYHRYKTDLDSSEPVERSSRKLKDQISQIMSEILEAKNPRDTQGASSGPSAPSWLARKKGATSGGRTQRIHRRLSVAERSSVGNAAPKNSEHLSTSKHNNASDKHGDMSSVSFKSDNERTPVKSVTSDINLPEGDLRTDMEPTPGGSTGNDLFHTPRDGATGVAPQSKNKTVKAAESPAQSEQRENHATDTHRRAVDGASDRLDATGPNGDRVRKPKRRKRNTKRRIRRHVGPHDEGGLQRLISTGTLAPPLLDLSDPDYSRSMDVIFATYWFYPAKTTILLPEDEQCIQNKLDAEQTRFDPSSPYYGMDHDAYGHEILEECLEESGHIPEEGTYESQSTYNPYDLHMGQMTVYRLRLKCVCKEEPGSDANTNGCATFLPFSAQQWAAYMGSKGTSHWVPRDVSMETEEGGDASNGFRCRR